MDVSLNRIFEIESSFHQIPVTKCQFPLLGVKTNEERFFKKFIPVIFRKGMKNEFLFLKKKILSPPFWTENQEIQNKNLNIFNQVVRAWLFPIHTLKCSATFCN